MPSQIDMAFVRGAFARSWPSEDHGSMPSVAGSVAEPSVAEPSVAEPVAQCAAVAAILRETEAGASVLLIRRATRKRDPWSGHMALPGGHREREDADLVQTAIREAREEVSLDLARDGELLARLAGVRPSAAGQTARLRIVPLVFALPARCQPTPNPREVEEIVWASLAHLLSPRSSSSHTHHAGRQRHCFPAFDVQGRVVWGLTYRILQELLGVVRRHAAAPDGVEPRARPADGSGTRQ